MTPEEREAVLWQLSEVAQRKVDEVDELSDDLLHAYRRGELSAEAAQAVERTLVASPASRQRLRDLAGVAAPTAPRRLRRRLLDRLAPRPRTYFGFGRGAVAAWGALAAAVLILVVGWPEAPAPEAIPSYEVGLQALTPRRSDPPMEEPASAKVAAARPETRVTITATVMEQAVPGIEVGLYRIDGEHLVRLDLDPRVEKRLQRGGVSFEASAAELVGTVTGEYQLVVVVVWEGDLPGEGPVSALSGNDRQSAYRLSLRLLEEGELTPF